LSASTNNNARGNSGTGGAKGERMIKEFPRDRDAKQKFLLEQVERIGPILQASGAESEELGTLAPEAARRYAKPAYSG
jgi:hypothetical protein